MFFRFKFFLVPFALRLFIAFLFLAQTVFFSAQGQTIIPVPPREDSLPDGEKIFRLSPSEKPLLPTPTISPANQLPELPTIPGSIKIDSIEIAGSTVFSSEELELLTRDFTNRQLTWGEIIQLRQVLTQLYVSQGYISSFAYIPPQQIYQGILKVEIIEGRVEAVEISGNKKLNSDYIRSRLQTKQPMSWNELVVKVALLEDNPLIEKIDIKLDKGSRLGTNILIVKVKEANSLSAGLGGDNTRSPNIGRFQRGIQVTERNFLGFGDKLSAIYRNTEGSNEGIIIYEFPINPNDGTIGIAYRIVENRILRPLFDIDGDGKGPDIESNYQQFRVFLQQRVINDLDLKFDLGVRLDRARSNSFLLGLPYPLARGADERGRIRLSTLRLFQEIQTRSSDQIFFASNEFSFGLGSLEFFGALDLDSTDGDYFIWRGNAQWVRRLTTSDLIFVGRTSIQLSDSPLPSLEQFSYGGGNFVRGYSVNELSRDNGIFLSGELRFPIWNRASPDISFQLAPFVDVGYGWDNSRVLLPTRSNSLASVGLGGILQISENLTCRVDYAFPLKASNEEEQRLSFSFSLSR